MRKPVSERAGLLLFAALMVVAALLRLPGDTGYANYMAPELVRDLGDVRGIAEGRQMLIGPPQFIDARYHFGPASDYLMLPLAWLTGFRPWSLAVTSLVSSLATIALGVYACLRWFRDRRVAAAFAVIATFSSLDVQFAKYASSPNFVPPFALMYFLCLEPFFRGEARARHACGLGFALAVCAQLHPVAGIGLGLVTIVAVALGRLRPTARQWAMIAGCALAVYAGYLWYDATHGLTDLRGLFGLASGQREFGGWGSRFAETAAFWFSLWFDVHHMFSVMNLVGIRALAWVYATIAVIAAVFVLERRSPRPTGRDERLPAHVRAMLLLWFAAPTALLLIPFGRINQLPIYYFVTFLPLGHLLMALGWTKTRDAGYRRTADVALGAFLVWQLGQLALYHARYPSMLI